MACGCDEHFAGYSTSDMIVIVTSWPVSRGAMLFFATSLKFVSLCGMVLRDSTQPGEDNSWLTALSDASSMMKSDGINNLAEHAVVLTHTILTCIYIYKLNKAEEAHQTRTINHHRLKPTCLSCGSKLDHRWRGAKQSSINKSAASAT